MDEDTSHLQISHISLYNSESGVGVGTTYHGFVWFLVSFHCLFSFSKEMVSVLRRPVLALSSAEKCGLWHHRSNRQGLGERLTPPYSAHPAPCLLVPPSPEPLQCHTVWVQPATSLAHWPWVNHVPAHCLSFPSCEVNSSKAPAGFLRFLSLCLAPGGKKGPKHLIRDRIGVYSQGRGLELGGRLGGGVLTLTSPASALGRSAFPLRPLAGPGRLSWQREEACLAGPGLPWGKPSWACRAWPSPWPQLGVGDTRG